MVFIIVMSLIFLIGVALMFGKKAWKKREWSWLIPSVLFSTIVTLCVGMVVALLMYVGTNIWSPDVEHDTYREANIVSLNDGQGDISNLHGTFFLGIGGVNGNSRTYLSYTWYERLNDGSLTGRMVLDDGWNDVRIYETCEPNNAHITKNSGYTRIDTPDWLAPMELHEKAILVTVWQICVPKGTVVHGYTLDGQV